MVYVEDLTPGVKLVITDWIDPENYSSNLEYQHALRLTEKHRGEELTFERAVTDHPRATKLGAKIKCEEVHAFFFASEVELLDPVTELQSCDLSSLNQLLSAVIP